jgi:hypothetical protein
MHNIIIDNSRQCVICGNESGIMICHMDESDLGKLVPVCKRCVNKMEGVVKAMEPDILSSGRDPIAYAAEVVYASRC